jgi:hypothetical protein
MSDYSLYFLTHRIQQTIFIRTQGDITISKDVTPANTRKRRIMHRTRNIFLYLSKALCIVTLVLLTISCSTTSRMYSGPELPASQTALIRGADSTINIESCDGVKVNSTTVSVLPGEHTIEMSFNDPLVGYSNYNVFKKFTVEAGHTYGITKKILATHGTYSVPITDQTTGKEIPATDVISQAQTEQKLASINKYNKMFPEDADFWAAKGAELFELRKYEEVLPALEKAISLKPDFADVWAMKGLVLCILKRCDEALVPIDKAIQIDPNSARFQNARNVILKGIKEQNKEK